MASNIMKINHYLWLIGILFIGLSLPCLPHAAEDPYTIDNIAVTAKGASATEAREIATASAEKQAFATLLANMGITSPPELTPESISALVTGMGVHNEKITPGYYSATMSISFNPDMTSEMLHHSGIQPTRNIADATADSSTLHSNKSTLINPLIDPLTEQKHTPSEIMATVPIANFPAWIALQKQLSTVDLIDHISLERISSVRAVIRIFFSVPTDILIKHLEDRSLMLTLHANGYVLTKAAFSTPPTFIPQQQ
jgi:hypothetical protein